MGENEERGIIEKGGGEEKLEKGGNEERGVMEKGGKMGKGRK